MTADGDGSGRDRATEKDYGGFVFDESGGRNASNESALPSLDQRVAPVVALLVIISLILAGGYVAFATLGGPTDDASGAAGGSGGSGAPNGSTALSASAPETTATAAQNTDTEVTTDTGTDTLPRTRVTTVAPATGGNDRGTPAATDPSESADTVSTTGTTAVDTPTTGTTIEATGASAAIETTEATETAEAQGSRSPSIDGFSAERQNGGDEGSALVVEWSVSDTDDDLESAVVTIVEDPGGSAQVVEQRTIETDGAEASSEFAIENPTPGVAYEVRLEVEDDAGNVAFAVTRVSPSE